MFDRVVAHSTGPRSGQARPWPLDPRTRPASASAGRSADERDADPVRPVGLMGASLKEQESVEDAAGLVRRSATQDCGTQTPKEHTPRLRTHRSHRPGQPACSQACPRRMQLAIASEPRRSLSECTQASRCLSDRHSRESTRDTGMRDQASAQSLLASPRRHVQRRRLTPGISCERPIRSTLVSFIPLFGGFVLLDATLPDAQTSVSVPAPHARHCSADQRHQDQMRTLCHRTAAPCLHDARAYACAQDTTPSRVNVHRARSRPSARASAPRMPGCADGVAAVHLGFDGGMNVRPWTAWSTGRRIAPARIAVAARFGSSCCSPFVTCVNQLGCSEKLVWVRQLHAASLRAPRRALSAQHRG